MTTVSSYARLTMIAIGELCTSERQIVNDNLGAYLHIYIAQGEWDGKLDHVSNIVACYDLITYSPCPGSDPRLTVLLSN